MRRLRRAATAVCLVSIATSTAVSLAQEPPEYNAKCGELDCRVERVTSPWEIIDVKRDRRALKLVYESGGCLRRDGHATVSETASTIEIAIDQGRVVAIDTPDGRVVCTADLRFIRLVVRLERPVAGRRLIGGPRIDLGFPIGLSRFVTTPNGRLIPLAPRSLGLAAQDARAMLKANGIEVTGARRGRVVEQVPAPGKRVGPEGVRLSVSR